MLKKFALQKVRFCFDSRLFAQHMIKKFCNPDKPLTMKIIQPTMHTDFLVNVFAKGSPYVKKFDEIFLQIFESGLQDSMRHGKKYLEVYEESKNPALMFRPSNDLRSQLLIFVTGCVSSTMIFVFELIFLWIKVRLNLSILVMSFIFIVFLRRLRTSYIYIFFLINLHDTGTSEFLRRLFWGIYEFVYHEWCRFLYSAANDTVTTILVWLQQVIN